ncbi:MAG: hypothetical protein ACK41T_01460 [Pseudobdellovibrio sp.]
MPNLIQKIETLLDYDDHFENLNLQKNLKFQIERNHEILEKIIFDYQDSQKQNQREKQWEIFFSRLTAFFEIGFLIKQAKNEKTNFTETQIQKMFYYGENIEKKLPRLKFNLPQSPLFNILKTTGKPFLAKMGLGKLPQVENMTCLLIRLDQNTYVALLTPLANPWLKLRCESLHKALIHQDYYLEEVSDKKKK